MKNSKKTASIAIAVIITLLIILMNTIKQPKKQEETQNKPEVTTTAEKPSCIDETELNTWFKVRTDEEAAWQKVNYRFYFTAKRMAAAPWINFQDVINQEPHGGIEGITAENKSDTCEIEVIKGKQNAWNIWHRSRMLHLDFIKTAYPKIKEAK